MGRGSKSFEIHVRKCQGCLEGTAKGNPGEGSREKGSTGEKTSILLENT